VREGGPSLAGHVQFEARGGDSQYYAFLQWLADGAFAAAQKTARNAGHPLIRIVADYLLTSRKCFER